MMLKVTFGFGSAVSPESDQIFRFMREEECVCMCVCVSDPSSEFYSIFRVTDMTGKSWTDAQHLTSVQHPASHSSQKQEHQEKSKTRLPGGLGSQGN